LSRRATNAGKHAPSATGSLSTPYGNSSGGNSPTASTTSLVMSFNFVGTAQVMFTFPGSNPGDLSVKAGDILNVIEQNDGNGWMTAEFNGTKGVLPSDYAEMQAAPPPQVAKAAKRRSLVQAPPPAEKVRALYEYVAQSDVELSIQEGDIIEITNKGIGGGWWEGKLNGKVGQFPENYVGSV